MMGCLPKRTVIKSVHILGSVTALSNYSYNKTTNLVYLSACFYMKIIIIEVLQRIYHWIRIETKTNQYDVEKIMLILTIMTFIFVMGCLV